MAAKLKTSEDWERLDASRMELALRELANSANLRFFLRSLLASTGATGTPDGGNALDMARSLGVHSVGTNLIETLGGYDPTLYPKLLLEDAMEQQERNSLEGDYDVQHS
jgi:hypothetical protein